MQMGGRGGWKDGCYVHNSLEVNEYLVKANLARFAYVYAGRIAHNTRGVKTFFLWLG